MTKKAFIIGWIILCVVVYRYVLSSIFGESSQATVNQPQPQPVVDQTIECYVDGLPVITTRDNCAALSQKQNQQVVVQQPVQRPLIQAPQAKRIEIGGPLFEQTLCHTNFDGSQRCYTRPL